MRSRMFHSCRVRSASGLPPFKIRSKGSPAPGPSNRPGGKPQSPQKPSSNSPSKASVASSRPPASPLSATLRIQAPSHSQAGPSSKPTVPRASTQIPAARNGNPMPDKGVSDRQYSPPPPPTTISLRQPSHGPNDWPWRSMPSSDPNTNLEERTIYAHPVGGGSKLIWLPWIMVVALFSSYVVVPHFYPMTARMEEERKERIE